jgi:hypothetical protein
MPRGELCTRLLLFFVPARNLAVSEKWLDPCVYNSRKRSWKKDIEETFLQSSEFTVTTTIDKRECTTKEKNECIAFILLFLIAVALSCINEKFKRIFGNSHPSS